ncbi:MAG: PHP domain-containing protein [Magnetococcales bacterium]|nr:PHP domain-containing protein [Magnetococcales bacterium]NGZ27630.1 PHP domain-containing protein [Magnetococcales bacterium]
MFDRTLFLSPNLTSPVPAWEYHLHSNHSDGSATMTALVETALAKGIARLIFTEHTEPDLVGKGDWFRRYADEFYTVRDKFDQQIELILGLEAPALDMEGTLLLTPEMEQEAQFILAAVHAYPGLGWNFRELSPTTAIEIEHKTLLGLFKNPRIDAIAHPGGVCSSYVAPFPMDLFEEIAALAHEKQVAIELNPAYQSPLLPYWQACHRQQTLISPGSNAHHPHQIGRAWQDLQTLILSQ